MESGADTQNMREHILLQGEAARETLRKNRKRVEELAEELKFEKILITGAGDKLIVPYIASFIWKAFGKKPIEIMHSRTLADFLPAYIDRETLAIFVSQSGKTKDTLDAARKVAEKNARMLAITNLKEREENSLWFIEEHGGIVLNTYTPIYPERALPSTLTFHASLILLYHLLSQLAGKDIYAELEALAEKVGEVSRESEGWGKEKAGELMKFNGLCKYVLGDGPRYGIARKLALIMLMEGAKENAAAIETEEFVHSLIETLEEENERKLPLLIFLPPHPTYESKIAELWKKHAYVLEIEAPEVSENPALNNLLSPQVQVIPAEWLAYYLAVFKGADPGVGKMVKKVRSEEILKGD